MYNRWKSKAIQRSKNEFKTIPIGNTKPPKNVEKKVEDFRKEFREILVGDYVTRLVDLIGETDAEILNESLLKQSQNNKSEKTTLQLLLDEFLFRKKPSIENWLIQALDAIIKKATVRHVARALDQIIERLELALFNEQPPTEAKSSKRSDDLTTKVGKDQSTNNPADNHKIKKFFKRIANKFVDFCPEDFLFLSTHDDSKDNSNKVAARLVSQQSSDTYDKPVKFLLETLGYSEQLKFFEGTVQFKKDNIEKQAFIKIYRFKRKTYLTRPTIYTVDFLTRCENIIPEKNINLSYRVECYWLMLLKKKLREETQQEESHFNRLHALIGRIYSFRFKNDQNRDRAMDWEQLLRQHYQAITSPQGLSAFDSYQVACFYRKEASSSELNVNVDFFRLRYLLFLQSCLKERKEKIIVNLPEKEDSEKDIDGLDEDENDKKKASSNKGNCQKLLLSDEVEGGKNGNSDTIGDEFNVLVAIILDENFTWSGINKEGEEKENIRDAALKLAKSSFKKSMEKYQSYLLKREGEIRCCFGFSRADYQERKQVHDSLKELEETKEKNVVEKRKSILAIALNNYSIVGGRRHECRDILEEMKATNDAFNEVLYRLSC